MVLAKLTALIILIWMIVKLPAYRTHANLFLCRKGMDHAQGAQRFLMEVMNMNA